MTSNRAWCYQGWHGGAECTVNCFVDSGSGNLWVCCSFHRVVAQLEAVASRVSWEESQALVTDSLLHVVNARQQETAVDPG